MAKYSKKAQDKIGGVMQKFKEGKLKYGPGSIGGQVKSRKQAIANGLSEALEAGEVPEKKTENSKKYYHAKIKSKETDS